MHGATEVEQYPGEEALVRSQAPKAETHRLMAETLAQALSQLRGQPVGIRKLRRQVVEYNESFLSERVELLLDRGENLRLFFKDLNPAHQYEMARKVRVLDLAPSYRELRVYQSILAGLGLGTPQLYAARWEPERGIYWLFLEDTGNSRLRECRNFAHWLSAAQWAARFHASARRLPDSQTNFLPQYDRSHYEASAERIEKLLPSLEARDRPAVERALDLYLERIDWFCLLRRTVVHGQFFGRNVMLRKRNSEQKIAVIDWETAARGPGAFDLASLSAGHWSASQKQSLWRAYFDRYRADMPRPLAWEPFCREVGAVALYQCLEWLGWWRSRSFACWFGVWMKDLERVLNDHFESN
jgi:aminoglycoside/choline kinase family phosphotransferase